MSTPAEPTATTPSTMPAPPPKRRGMQGNVKSMVLSMIACLAGCLVLLALIPRQGPTQYPTVDEKGVAQQVVGSQKWDVALVMGVPSVWRPVNVQLVAGDVDTKARWQAGYQGKGTDYIAVYQTKGGGQAWINSFASGSNEGSVDVNGVKWQKISLATGGQKSLVRTQPLAGLDTLVIGKGSWAQLEQFARGATPYSQLKTK